jgi:hypothetical protein
MSGRTIFICDQDLGNNAVKNQTMPIKIDLILDIGHPHISYYTFQGEHIKRGGLS